MNNKWLPCLYDIEGHDSNCINLLQVETFGSMEKKEKVEFILEQMRLCIAKKDYIRTQIISKKINTKFFDDPGTEVTVSISKQLCVRNRDGMAWWGKLCFFCIV